MEVVLPQCVGIVCRRSRESVCRCQPAVRSPSCGNLENYDGSFSGVRVPGEGGTAALLKRAGVKVFNEMQLDEAAAELARLERD